MARSVNLPDSFTAEMTRVGGSFPRFVLGIDYDGTLKYYSDVSIGTSELNATGNITDWGQLQLQATPGAVGGHQNISLTLADPDLTLMDEFTDWPGIQTRPCYIYMYYDPAPTGGGWADRITLFKGIVGPGVKFDEKSATWNLSLVDIGKHNNPTIGVHFSRQIFSEMNCSTCGDDAIIPIAYGDPVKGVRACVIQRPGSGVICQTECTFYAYGGLEGVPCIFRGTDLWFTICSGTRWQFSPGEQCVVLSDRNRLERVCGRLHSTGLFEVYDFNNYSHFSWDAGSQRNARDSWVATGRGSYYVIGGVKYLTLPKAAFADWTNGGAGFADAIGVWVNCDGWRWFPASIWASVSGSHVAFVNLGDGTAAGAMDPCPDNNYEFVAAWGPPGTSSNTGGWGTGTGVRAGDPFVYAVNFLPSEEVLDIHFKDQNYVNHNYWHANVDDKSYNIALKRAPSDDGITTITLHTWWEVYNPLDMWSGENQKLDSILVNLRGIVGHAEHRAYDGDALKHPVDVIEDYLTNPFLGNTPYAMIDTASFDAAKDRIDDLTQDIAPSSAPQGLRFAFAQYKTEELNTYIQEMAVQGTMLLFWDMGMATLRAIFPNWQETDTVFEVNESNQQDDTFGFDILDIEKSPTELVGLFTAYSDLYNATYNFRSDRAIEQRIIRRSTEAELFRPRKSESVTLGAYQEVYSVSYVLETWLRDRVNTSANVTVTLYLDAMHLQPGDIIDIQRQSGVPKVLMHKLARVESTSQNVGDSRNGSPGLIKAKSQIRLTDFAIEAAQFIEQDCDQAVTAPGVTTAPPRVGPATTTVLPTSTTVTVPPATTLPATTTVNPEPPTTVTTTTTTPPTCTASGDCAWQYDPSSPVAGSPCWPFVLIDSDCGVDEFCHPMYSGGNANGCPSGNPGFLQCLSTPCQTATTTAPTTTTTTSTTLTTPAPNCAGESCYWDWVVTTNGQGQYLLNTTLSNACTTIAGCDCLATPPGSFTGPRWWHPCGSGWATTTTTTSTTTTPPTSTTATTQMACIGNCGWVWEGAPNQQGNSWYGQWRLFMNSCQGDLTCGCCEPVPEGGSVAPGQPSYNPDQTRPGSELYFPCQTTDCASPVVTSTTTTVPPITTPTTSTTVTTSSTTTTTTTTTVSPAGTCEGDCVYVWEEGSCEGFCHYTWDVSLSRWVVAGTARCIPSNGASCECNPYDPVAIDPTDATAGGTRNLIGGNPEHGTWLSRCTCVGVASDQPNNQGDCSGQYVLLNASVSGTDEYCECPNPPPTRGASLLRMSAVSWSSVYATTTTTTTTTAAPDPCDAAPGAPCACGCAEFTWDPTSPVPAYYMTQNLCTGICNPPAAPFLEGDPVIFRCCE